MAARGFSVLQRTIIPCANVSGSSSNGSAFWAFPKKGISSCARMRGGAGRTRTNNQSVMECGRVRPAHLVGHEALELRGPLMMGHFHKSGNLQCARMRGGAG